MKAFAIRLLMSMATQEFLEWAFFYVAGLLVKRTDTPHDDAWLGQVRSAYYVKKDGG